jgi:CGNR zinc finger
MQREKARKSVTLGPIVDVVRELPMPLLVDLVNGWGSVPRERAAGRPRASTAELGTGQELPPVLAGVSDDELERVADLVHPVFAEPDPAARALLVSALLAQTRVRPVMTASGSGLEAAWQVDDPGQALLASAAVALRAELVTRDPERLGTCDARGCCDVFVDTSPGARRRFCSVTCQNRERVAAFRRRRRP